MAQTWTMKLVAVSLIVFLLLEAVATKVSMTVTFPELRQECLFVVSGLTL